MSPIEHGKNTVDRDAFAVPPGLETDILRCDLSMIPSMYGTPFSLQKNSIVWKLDHGTEKSLQI